MTNKEEDMWEILDQFIGVADDTKFVITDELEDHNYNWILSELSGLNAPGEE